MGQDRNQIDVLLAGYAYHFPRRVTFAQQPPDGNSFELGQECLIEVFLSLFDAPHVPVLIGQIMPAHRHTEQVTRWLNNMQENYFRPEVPCKCRGRQLRARLSERRLEPGSFALGTYDRLAGLRTLIGYIHSPVSAVARFANAPSAPKHATH